MWNCSYRLRRRLKKEEFRQSESFSSLHHCTDSTGVSPNERSPSCSGLESVRTPAAFFFLFFFFWSGGAVLSSLAERLILDFVIEEKQYLWSRFVCVVVFLLLWTGWTGFWILNKLLFCFHTRFLSFLLFEVAVLPSRHVVSVESFICFYMSKYIKHYKV